LVNAPGALIVANKILNYSSGIHMGDEEGVVIERNLLQGNNGTGISGAGDGYSIRENTLSGFSGGVEMRGGGVGDIANNHIESSYGGIVIQGLGRPNLTGNSLVGGAIVFETSSLHGLPDTTIGPNNTVNGLPVVFERGGQNLTYDGDSMGQIILMGCDNVSLANLSFSDVSLPIQLLGIWHFSLTNVSVQNASSGISLVSAWMGHIESSRFHSTGGIRVYDALNLTFENNVVEKGTDGISLMAVGGIELTNNTVEGGPLGALSLRQAYEVRLRQNRFVGAGLQIDGTEPDEYRSHDIDASNTVDGAPLVYVRDLQDMAIENRAVGQLIVANGTNVRVSNVKVEGTHAGIMLAFSSNLSLANVSVVSLGLRAVSAYEVDGLSIAGSAIRQAGGDPWGYSAVALLMAESRNISVADVEINGSGWTGLDLEGGANLTVIGSSIRGQFSGATLSRVEGAQVVASQFWGGHSGLKGYNIGNASITDSSFRGGGGIQMAYFRDSTIAGNVLEGLAYSAIDIDLSRNTMVTGNQVRDSGIGISAGGAGQGVALEGNSIVGNRIGIQIEARSNNEGFVIFRNNTVEGNHVGVAGNLSQRILLYHNRFINNTIQSRVSPGGQWDAGYLIGGNFWSDYLGTDNCSGLNQDQCPDPDQFGDTPYCMGAPPGASESMDHYPLMNLTPPPPRQPPPPPVEPAKPTTLDPISAGLPAIALILAVIAAGIFLSLRRKPVEKLEDEELRRLE
jgi:parallel beta-helix repeat protein